MKREILLTSDGSTTIHLPDWNEQYHSKHGAIQEAYHVFIKNGLRQFRPKSTVAILEIGFGTGLNCFITYLEGVQQEFNIEYTGVEAYPVVEKELAALNYVSQLKAEMNQPIFQAMHSQSWNKKHQLSPNFTLCKKQLFFQDIKDEACYDLIYFDAFGARVQPELWSEAIFKKMYKALKPNGILVTYSAKGSVRRAMEAIGFMVERLQGPPGKRHMLRAIKK